MRTDLALLFLYFLAVWLSYLGGLRGLTHSLTNKENSMPTSLEIVKSIIDDVESRIPEIRESLEEGRSARRVFQILMDRIIEAPEHGADPGLSACLKSIADVLIEDLDEDIRYWERKLERTTNTVPMLRTTLNIFIEAGEVR
jgi:hypothetical protein